MREIKFRAWRPKAKEMVSPRIVGLLAPKCEYPVSISSEGVYFHPQLANESEGIVLMQFTGLKDKNGVEIYEGSIVKVSWLAELGITELDCEAIGVIEYAQAEFHIRLVPPYKTGIYCGEDCPGNYEQEFVPLYQPEYWDEGYCVEVIGNIHENPDLLKGGERRG